MDEEVQLPRRAHALSFEMAMGLEVLRRRTHSLLVVVTPSLGMTIIGGRRSQGAYGIALGFVVGTWSAGTGPGLTPPPIE
jgi:hypothetical protein